MQQLRQKPVNLRQTEQIQWHWIDRNSGHLSAQGCEGAMYIPLLRSNMPRQATGCGIPHYQVEPADTPNTENNQTPVDQNDSIGNYIRESETETQNDGSTNQIISSGSYNN